MIYQATSEEGAIDQIVFIRDKWEKQYPRVVKSLMNPNLLTLFNFLSSIRKSVYSTNLIEGFNKQLKKINKEIKTIS